MNKAIAAEKHYPKAARRQNLQGHVEVRIVIRQSGKLAKLSITESSGHDNLDSAALHAIKNAAPFGAMPASMHRTRMSVIVPFDFGLQN
ncbi:energy transducer TonB [Salinisphaera sp. USBA-960]|nr:energy transducer TonB [Salifodinibacter halophilus]NNC26648.1 energy transducer TonB [Salifodinibacter halophilus]